MMFHVFFHEISLALDKLSYNKTKQLLQRKERKIQLGVSNIIKDFLLVEYLSSFSHELTLQCTIDFTALKKKQLFRHA